ncbi:MAG: heme-degrading monooxygenase HmoA [Limisphaerales bacterium]|jgi:heme-degrading monooxygenase HmoA
MTSNYSAKTPLPPYYAVIFTSIRKEGADGYDQTSERMEELVNANADCFGFESFRNENGFGVTISYWKDDQAIKGWKQNEEYQTAQQKGQAAWYSHYKLRICKVERDYGFDEGL